VARTIVGVLALDLDGTMVDGQELVPASTLDALAMAREHGFIPTIITGRGLPRLHTALSETALRVFGTQALVGVEHGTRLVSLDGLRQVHHLELPAERVNSFLHELPMELVTFVAYHPHDKPLWSVVWTPHHDVRERLRQDFASADIHEGSFPEFVAGATADRPGMIVARMSSRVPPGSPDVISAGTNLTLISTRDAKGVALRRICELSGVRLEESIAAGNDEADAAMLRLIPRQRRIVVGADQALAVPDYAGAIRVHDPDHLPRAIEIAVLQEVGQVPIDPAIGAP
jgi:hydroxymethylpyrimidine pyrophosphatase-like HAD family hydrolase